jgi:hypothetical protein
MILPSMMAQWILTRLPSILFIADLEADDAPRHVFDQGRGPLAKKLMFSSQEMPDEHSSF